MSTDRAVECACQEAIAEWALPGGPGLALAVVRGTDVHLAAGGLADVEQETPLTAASRFNIASVSKQFTGACVALAIEDGLLDSTEPVREIVPELPAFADAVTIDHLLRHTSGIRDCWELQMLAGWRNWDVMTHADALEIIFRQQEANFAPGATWSYSNSGYVLLAEVLQRLSGQAFRDFAAERVFAPLGMDSTLVHDSSRMLVPGRARAYLEDADGELQAADANSGLFGTTGVFSSVEDLARWVGSLGTATLAGPALIERMTAPGALADGRPVSYGYGLFLAELDGRRTIEHSGQHGGSVTQLLHLPDEGLSVVACANALTTPVFAIATAIARAGLSPRAPVPPSAIAAEALPTGVYRRREGGLLTRIKVDGGVATFGFGERAPRGEEPTVFVAPPRGMTAVADDPPAAILDGDDRERLVFAADGKQIRTHSQEDALPRTYDRIEAPGIAADASGELGTFHSPEIDSSLRATLESGRLRLVGRRFEALWLEAIDPSLFAGTAIGVELEGDPAAPGALLVTTPLLWRLRFVREPSGPRRA
jgi:CubicO group peptidase (beta-lactamase class C family)